MQGTNICGTSCESSRPTRTLGRSILCQHTARKAHALVNMGACRPRLAVRAATENGIGTSQLGMGTLSLRRLDKAIHDAVHEEVEHELEMMEQRLDSVFKQEMSSAKQEVQEAMETAFQEGMRVDITANVNTLMAITGVISYWRGVGGLLDWLFEDSLEGYIVCLLFGLGVTMLIRVLKLPVVEGSGGGF